MWTLPPMSRRHKAVRGGTWGGKDQATHAADPPHHHAALITEIGYNNNEGNARPPLPLHPDPVASMRSTNAIIIANLHQNAISGIPQAGGRTLPVAVATRRRGISHGLHIMCPRVRRTQTITLDGLDPLACVGNESQAPPQGGVPLFQELDLENATTNPRLDFLRAEDVVGPHSAGVAMRPDRGNRRHLGVKPPHRYRQYGDGEGTQRGPTATICPTVLIIFMGAPDPTTHWQAATTTTPSWKYERMGR